MFALWEYGLLALYLGHLTDKRAHFRCRLVSFEQVFLPIPEVLVQAHVDSDASSRSQYAASYLCMLATTPTAASCP
jgi:hypothetical protein